MNQTLSDSQLVSSLQNFVQTTVQSESPQAITIQKLFGQASARQYFRASTPSSQTFIIMKMPQGFASLAEETTKIAADAPQEFPFLNIQKYLASLGLPVPAVLDINAAQGLVPLQDLGDKMLENLVSKQDSTFKVFYYKKVIDTLIELQTQTAAHPPKEAQCIAGFRHFDESLLLWELDHFREYGLEDRFGLQLTPQQLAQWHQWAAPLAQGLAQQPQGFVHRDFQSRNIMVHQMDFYLIDFQDALIGPVLYDLVGLLRDSYISFSPSERDQLLHYYVDKLPPAHPYAQAKERLWGDFFALALQRKLKDTGRFQFIHTVKKNPNFLVSVPQSIVYIKESFEALQNQPWGPFNAQQWRAWQTWIGQWIPELL